MSWVLRAAAKLGTVLTSTLASVIPWPRLPLTVLVLMSELVTVISVLRPMTMPMVMVPVLRHKSALLVPVLVTNEAGRVDVAGP